MRLAGLFCAVLMMFGCATFPARAESQVASSFAHSALPSSVIVIEDVEGRKLGPAIKRFDEKVAKGEKTVMFRLSSYGGSIADGLDFIQHVEDAKKENGVKVICVADWKAMSMGFAILQGACDERLMTKRALLMAHGASTVVQGKVDDIKNSLAETEAINEAMAEICSARLKISIDEYKAKTAHNNWDMSWKEALEVGAIDGTINPSEIPVPEKLEAPAQPSLFDILGGKKD